MLARVYVRHRVNVQGSNHLAGVKWSNGAVGGIRGLKDET